MVTIANWVERYGRAWETADEELIISLFTEDVSYRSSPFREPYRGHDELRAYWRRGAGNQRETHVLMGRPVVDGARVVVECWTTMIDDDAEVTLPGCLLLEMAEDGRCRDLREYWNRAEGRTQPFAGWGWHERDAPEHYTTTR